MFVTMVTPISSHVKDKNSIFTAYDEDMIFSKRKNPGISSEYLYNKLLFKVNFLLTGVIT